MLHMIIFLVTLKLVDSKLSKGGKRWINFRGKSLRRDWNSWRYNNCVYIRRYVSDYHRGRGWIICTVSVAEWLRTITNQIGALCSFSHLLGVFYWRWFNTRINSVNCFNAEFRFWWRRCWRSVWINIIVEFPLNSYNSIFNWGYQVAENRSTS